MSPWEAEGQSGEPACILSPYRVGDVWVVAVGNDQEERTWHSGVGLGTTAGEGTEATARTLAPGNPETHKPSFGIDSSLKIHSSVVKRKGVESRQKERKNRKKRKNKRIDLIMKERKGLQGSPVTPRTRYP